MWHNKNMADKSFPTFTPYEGGCARIFRKGFTTIFDFKLDKNPKKTAYRGICLGLGFGLEILEKIMIFIHFNFYHFQFLP